jgi:hypothetical protein
MNSRKPSKPKVADSKDFIPIMEESPTYNIQKELGNHPGSPEGPLFYVEGNLSVE